MSMQSSTPAIVYRATNLVNGKCYVGWTAVGLELRRKGHIKDAFGTSKLRFHRALKKYGPDCFEFVVLREFPSPAWALAGEVYYIAQLAPEYNLTRGGEGVWGLKKTPEQIERGAAAARGRPSPFKGVKQDPSITAKRVKTCRERDSWPRPMLGKTHTPEARKKISTNRTPVKPWLGKKMTAEQRRTLSLAHSTPVTCVTDGREFESTSSAASFYGLHRTSVSGTCSGRYRSVRGLIFRWLK